MRRSFIHLLGIILVTSIFIGVMVISFVELRLRPLVNDLAASRARQLSSELIDAAVTSLLADGEALVSVTHGADGIAGAQINTRAIARLRTDAVRAVTAGLASADSLRLTVPLFNLTDSALASGFGIPVTVRMLPVGDITADVRTEFSESGINQVLHRVTLRVRLSLRLLAAGRVTAIDIASDIPLAETVIVGAVPDAYTAINRYEIDEEEENDLNDYAASIP